MVTKSNWFGIHCCVACSTSLCTEEKYYSDGICPYCGHITKSTICDTVVVIAREIRTSYPWYRFKPAEISLEYQTPNTK